VLAVLLGVCAGKGSVVSRARSSIFTQNTTLRNNDTTSPQCEYTIDRQCSRGNCWGSWRTGFLGRADETSPSTQPNKETTKEATEQAANRAMVFGRRKPKVYGRPKTRFGDVAEPIPDDTIYLDGMVSASGRSRANTSLTLSSQSKTAAPFGKWGRSVDQVNQGDAAPTRLQRAWKKVLKFWGSTSR